MQVCIISLRKREEIHRGGASGKGFSGSHLTSLAGRLVSAVGDGKQDVVVTVELGRGQGGQKRYTLATSRFAKHVTIVSWRLAGCLTSARPAPPLQHLPTAWDRATLRNVSLGSSRLDIEFARQGDQLLIRARSAVAATVCLVPQTATRDQDCSGPAALLHELKLPLPAVEVGVPPRLPLPGARTSQLKVVGERLDSNRYELSSEGLAGSCEELPVRLNHVGVQAAGAELAGSILSLQFPQGDGYQRVDVVFTW